MKIFKYWASEKVRTDVYGEIKEFNIYGGSNISTADAAQNAIQKAELIKRKIEGDRSAFEEYEVDIREEILQVVDDKNIITRNRYGAQVLNTEYMLILDIDKPKPAGLMGLFKKASGESDKDKIFNMARTQAASPKYAGLGFRLYETYQGARVIVTGRDFNARDSSTFELMKDFNTDPLYAAICRKQGCFRARLTPKPNRIQMKAYKVKYPRSEPDALFDLWLRDYEQASRSFSVCRFVEQIGSSFGTSEALRLHDEITGANLHLPLA